MGFNTPSPANAGFFLYVINPGLPMYQSFAAILTGAVLGHIALAPLQAVTNTVSVSLCEERTDTHTLIVDKNYFGTLKSCIDNRLSLIHI